MNSFTRFLLPLTALIALATTPLSAADRVELKQRWISGKKYFFSMQMAQQSSFAVGPQKMEQQVATTIEMSVAVHAHEDGQRQRLTLKQDRVAMDMTMNGQKMGFDSAKPTEGTDPLGMGKMMGAVVGKEIKMLTNAAGEVVDIENYDEFVKTLPTSPMPGMDMAKMFSKDMLLQSMKQVALISLPGKPVATGESWPFSKEIEMPQLGKVAVKGPYTFKGLADHAGVRCAEVQTDGAMAIDFAAGAGGAMGMKITDGSLKGPVWFDPALGMARESQLTQVMKMSMKNPADPAAPIIEVPMTQTTTTTLTKIEDVK